MSFATESATGKNFEVRSDDEIVKISGLSGSPENTGLENGGQKKSRGWKMQDWKMTDESAGLENDGLEKMTLFLRHRL